MTTPLCPIRIPLRNAAGETVAHALVDADQSALAVLPWYLGSEGYAKRGRGTYMHREIANAPRGMITDHIDGNRLNNQRSNLRVCNCRQNNWNCGRQKNNASGFRGVHFNKKDGKWQAMARTPSGRECLGSFLTAAEASAAYEAFVKKLRGEFYRPQEIAS